MNKEKPVKAINKEHSTPVAPENGWMTCNYIKKQYVIGNRKKTNESTHEKTNKMACAPCKDSDQPRHLLSLIRVFAVRSMVVKDPSFLHAGSEDSDGGCPGWSESSLGAHAILLVLSCAGSNEEELQQKYWLGTVYKRTVGVPISSLLLIQFRLYIIVQST